MPLLYVETNLLLGVATGRLRSLDGLFHDASSSVRLAIPAVSVMEAFTAGLREQATNREFSQRVRSRIEQIRESGQLPEFADMRARLEEALLFADRALVQVQSRLAAAVEISVRRFSVVQFEPADALAALNDVVCKQPTDNLILHTILRHAASDSDPSKAFFSQNLADFTINGGRDRLRSAGVAALLATTEALDGWLAAAARAS